jgi:hypothetical protein
MQGWDLKTHSGAFPRKIGGLNAASSISTPVNTMGKGSFPNKQYGLEQFCEVIGQRPVDPGAHEIVIDYGLWSYQQVICSTDQTYVRTTERQESQFMLSLYDEQTTACKAVIILPGPGYCIQ